MILIEDIGADYWLAIYLSLKAIRRCEDEANPIENMILANIESAEEWLTDHSRKVKFFKESDEIKNLNWRGSTNYIHTSAYYINLMIKDYLLNNHYDEIDFEDSVGYTSDHLSIDEYEFFTSIVLDNLSFIIDYKLKKEQGFKNIQAIFDMASDDDRERLLFCLGNNANG